MKITLMNGTELNPILIMGGVRFVQGAHRDTLNFIFPEDVSMDFLAETFTPENCEKISITDDMGEYVYYGYTINTELKRSPVIVVEASETEDEIIENRVTITMSQKTYTESQVANGIMGDTITAVDTLLNGEE